MLSQRWKDIVEKTTEFKEISKNNYKSTTERLGNKGVIVQPCSPG